MFPVTTRTASLRVCNTPDPERASERQSLMSVPGQQLAEALTSVCRRPVSCLDAAGPWDAGEALYFFRQFSRQRAAIPFQIPSTSASSSRQSLDGRRQNFCDDQTTCTTALLKLDAALSDWKMIDGCCAISARPVLRCP